MLHLLQKIPLHTVVRPVVGCSAVAAATVLLLSVAGCSKSDDQTTTTSPTAQSPSAAASPARVAAMEPIETCGLLTSEELEAVQGEPLANTKPTTHNAQGLAMYDCFFALPTFTNSVSLSITQSGRGPDARDARQSWRETLAAAAAKAGPKVDPPKMIEGLGEEAFWTGDDKIGALYVLAGPRFVRISVGGAPGRESKIEKSRALAEVVLKKL